MTPDEHQRILLACLAAHIKRNTANNSLSLSDADVRDAYESEPEFRLRRDQKSGTVRVELVQK